MSVLAQDYNQITTSGAYLYSEGFASSKRMAENFAEESLSKQINVHVSSYVTTYRSSEQTDGSKGVHKSDQLLIETYSNVTLYNCKEMLLENGPTYRVLKYIHKDEVERIFESRREKVLEWINVGLREEEERKFGNALKHYYWAQLLLETIPHPSELRCNVPNEGERMVVGWLPNKIDEILDGLSFSFGGYTTENKTLATIYVTYNGKPVTNLDYSYFDGQGWATTQVKDGLSSIELRANTTPTSINIKVEYCYENEMGMDPELRHYAEHLKQIEYRKATKNAISLESPQAPIENKDKWKMVDVAENKLGLLKKIENITPYKETVKLVLEVVSDRNYDAAKPLFTEEGYDIYSKLISYGRAQVIANHRFNPIEEIEVTQFGDRYFCRSIPMQFSFPNHNKSFVENVVFVFNPSGKISSLQFCLEQVSIDDILSKTKWSNEAKFVLVDFLENYRTAYALERLDYIESIFSENALIITGRVVKNTSVEGQLNLRNKAHIVYNRQTKGEYINNLRRSFASKEYINLQFSNLKVSKMNRGNRDNYTIEIKQDYYSSNYADTGYLMLVVDVTDPVSPIIHVRTWQPKPDPEFGLFSPGDL